MEKEKLSIGELIDTARGCVGDLTGNACVNCTFKGGDYDCTSMLLLALADKLEELSGQSRTPVPTIGGVKESVRRCATCRYEDRMAEEARCIECEKHSLWEERK